MAGVMRDWVNRVVFIAVAIIVTVVYTVLLPFDYTQQVSFGNWQYLDIRLVAFAVAFGIGIAALVTLQVYAIRRIATGSRGAATGVAGVLGLLPSFLCCSPIVPTLVGLLALPTAAAYRTTGTIQYFFATKQNLILGASLAIVALSLLWSFRRIVKAACLTGCDTLRVPDKGSEP